MSGLINFFRASNLEKHVEGSSPSMNRGVYKIDLFSFSLETYQVRKVISVALGILAFFALQFGFSLIAAGAISLACASVCLLSEVWLRPMQKQKCDWFSFEEMNKTSVMIHVALRLTLLPAIIAFSTASGNLPLQRVALQIMAFNPWVIFLANIVAPLAEEIVFRGFIQERFEDLVYLIDLYLYSFPDNMKIMIKSGLSISATGIFFGYLHIIGDQVRDLSMKMIVFLQITLTGLFYSYLKNRDNSLLSTMGIHFSQNGGVTLGLLSSKFLVKA